MYVLEPTVLGGGQEDCPTPLESASFHTKKCARKGIKYSTRLNQHLFIPKRVARRVGPPASMTRPNMSTIYYIISYYIILTVIMGPSFVHPKTHNYPFGPRTKNIREIYAKEQIAGPADRRGNRRMGSIQRVCVTQLNTRIVHANGEIELFALIFSFFANGALTAWRSGRRSQRSAAIFNHLAATHIHSHVRTPSSHASARAGGLERGR